jgi:DNA-binding transcriptional LysR family regulator
LGDEQVSLQGNRVKFDLNDLYYFCEIVRHGGIAAAERATHEPKSKLSRRLANLEDRLGVRLVERSTRRFRVTEVGQTFFQHCRNMVLEAEQAQAVVAGVRERPAGPVRFYCPTGMLETVMPILAGFLASYPDVSLEIVTSNTAIDLIEQRVESRCACAFRSKAMPASRCGRWRAAAASSSPRR